MTVGGPKVRDYTEGRRQLQVEVDASPAYELVLSLFAFGCSDRKEYEVGSEFFESTYADASAELRLGLDLMSTAGELLVGLLGIVHDLPQPKSIDALLSRLEDMDPIELRAHLLRWCAPGLGDDELYACAAGDRSLLERHIAEHDADKHRPAFEAVLEGDAGALRDRIVDTLRRFAAEQLPDIAKLTAVLERDADEKRAMAATRTPERLVELATNGVTFATQPDVRGVVLIPSIVVRPWVVIAGHDGLRFFAYSVTDEAMTADPDAPPAWMVRFYKALGDEKRMRILGILADGSAGLGDLAERLGLGKSTVHHHVSILRQAGLVRVTVGADKEYSLRQDIVPHASAMLSGFLGMATKEKEPT